MRPRPTDDPDTNARLSVSVHRPLAIAAATERRPIRDVINEAVTDYLRTRHPDILDRYGKPRENDLQPA